MDAARAVLRPSALAALRPISTTTTTTTTSSSSLTTSLQSLCLSRGSYRAFSITQTNLKASTRRTKKALNVAPHPSFLSSLTESQDHIIFNPPASAPSVYNTPYKFLPKSDPRRRSTLPSRLFHDKSSPISSLPFSSGDSPSSSTPSVPLPPPATALDRMVSKYHLGPEDVEEMRRLRNSDPVKWHVKKLAKKYECSTFFVMACTRASEEHQKRLRERQEKIKARWGPIRTKAREEREKRKKMLLQGLL